VDAAFTYFNVDPGNMRNIPELGGGVIPDIGVYPTVVTRFATGKEPTDVARRKKTLPVIYAFAHAMGADRDRLAALYANGRLLPEHVEEITAILERVGARDYTRDQARLHRDRALAELDAAGTLEREPRERLEEIVRSVISA